MDIHFWKALLRGIFAIKGFSGLYCFKTTIFNQTMLRTEQPFVPVRKTDIFGLLFNIRNRYLKCQYIFFIPIFMCKSLLKHLYLWLTVIEKIACQICYERDKRLMYFVPIWKTLWSLVLAFWNAGQIPGVNFQTHLMTSFLGL